MVTNVKKKGYIYVQEDSGIWKHDSPRLKWWNLVKSIQNQKEWGYWCGAWR